MKINAFGKARFKKQPLPFWIFTLLLAVFLTVFFGAGLFFNDNSADVSAELFKKNDYPGFESYAKGIGAQKAYGLLKAYFKKNEPEAHDFAHVIGFIAVEESDIKGLNICDNFYNYGCFHGFMQVYLNKHGISAVKNMEKSCNELGFVHAPSCLHGIGHGLMMESSYGLFDALENCQILEDSFQTYCFDGVFMERIAGSMLSSDEKLKITPDNLFDPCMHIDNKFKRECWRNQVAVWFSFFQNDTAKVGSYCAAIDSKYWPICFETIGLISVQMIGEDLQKLTASCQIVSEFGHDLCLLGVVKELLFEGKSPSIAFEICNLVGSANKQSCFETYDKMNNDNRQRFG